MPTGIVKHFMVIKIHSAIVLLYRIFYIVECSSSTILILIKYSIDLFKFVTLSSDFQNFNFKFKSLVS